MRRLLITLALCGLASPAFAQATPPVLIRGVDTGTIRTVAVDSSGRLTVTCASGCSGSGGTSSTDGAAFVADTTAGTPAMGAYQSTVSALTDGDVGVVGMTTGRAMKTALANADGSLITLASDATNDAAAGTSGPQIMGLAEATTPASVTDGDAVRPWYTLNGNAMTRNLDPCSGVAKSYFVVNLAAATVIEIANPVANEFYYICSVNLVAGGADNVLIASDNTDDCVSLTAGLNGGTTAATGWNFAANGGIALGDGNATVMKTATANHALCILPSTTAQLSGTIAYVSAP